MCHGIVLWPAYLYGCYWCLLQYTELSPQDVLLPILKKKAISPACRKASQTIITTGRAHPHIMCIRKQFPDDNVQILRGLISTYAAHYKIQTRKSV